MPGINRVQIENQGGINNFGVQGATSNDQTENKENKGDTADLLAKELDTIRKYITDLRADLFGNNNDNNNNDLSAYSNNSQNSWLG